MKILITGFGSFPGVKQNPSGALAQSVNGKILENGMELIGIEIPTSFVRGPEMALRVAREHDVIAVVSLGVATSRSTVTVESLATCVKTSAPDIDGETKTCLMGPAVVCSTGPVQSFSRSLSGSISTDAGGYVCNALLYKLVMKLSGVRVCFVHIPLKGLNTETFLQALPSFVDNI